MKKTILKNVAASWLVLASQLAIVFLLTPLVIRKIGVEAYGLWLLLQSVSGYYGFIDAGLRTGVAQSISRHIAAKETQRIRDHLATVVPVLAAFAGAILIFSVLVGIYLPTFVTISPELATGLLPIVVLQALSVAVQLPFAPFGAILFGYQRLDLDAAISIAVRIGSSIVIWIALTQGHGLLMMSIVAAISNTTFGLLRWVIARQLCPAIRGFVPKFTVQEFRSLWHFGAWNSVILVSRQIIHLTDAVVVGVLLTPKHVAYFGIAGSIIEYFNEILGSAARVLFPAMAKMHVSGELAEQRKLYKTATTSLVALSIAMFSVGVCWYKQFVVLWLGNTEDTQQIAQMSFPVFVTLGLAVVVGSFQRAGTQLVIASGSLKKIALLYLFESILNLTISLAAGYAYGLLGVAVGTLIPAFIFTFLFHIPLHCRSLNVSFSRLVADVTFRTILVAVLYVGTVCALKSFWSNPTKVYEFGAIGLLCLVIFLPFQVLLLGKNDRIKFFTWLKKRSFA